MLGGTCKKGYGALHNYTTVVNSTKATTESVLSLCSIDNIHCNKRKADGISALDAKRQKNIGAGRKKHGQTPNTTRGADGFEVCNSLHQHNVENNAEMRQKEKELVAKQIKEYKKILSKLEKLVQKKTRAAAGIGIDIRDKWIWSILQPKAFIKAEHQLFLKLCVPKSGVLCKDE